jgi:arsenate reductase
VNKRVLILCTGNSCRSQMAEGFWRHHAGKQWDVRSAGIAPVGVNPLAVEAMAEVGIDISRHTSKSLDEFVTQPFDLVITVCGNADRNCPVFPNATRREHWPFDDPANAVGPREERLREFRRVRDEIGRAVRAWLGIAET